MLAGLKADDPALDEAMLRGLARGWPKGKPAKLEPAVAESIKRLAQSLPTGCAGSSSAW